MSSRDHTIDAKIKADTSDFEKGMSAVDKGLDKGAEGFSKYGTEAEKAGKQTQSFVQANRAHMESLGKDAMLMGAGMLAGLGLAAKAAMSWESAWAGVRKTVDGSPEEMASLEKELRGLATTLPATHEEIAGVAEAAGQLGIERENVAAFTKTMIDLGESTNLSAEEAATGLARFSNVMGTNQKDAFRLGSTLVGLGNNFATTESEILAMSMRLAGAGNQAGLTEGQVMGLAAGMSSVGIEAEAGGTAMSLTMKRIGKSVDEGGESLELFASTAGMSAQQFQAAWKNDASGALEAFVVGLDEAGQSGESVNGILTELGITGIREADALLRLSAAGALMGDSMRQGGEEFQKGTALLVEATKRYETTESKVKIAWNNIKDAAIDAGAVLLPVISGIADSAVGLAKAFGSLPDPVKGGIVAVAGITGGVLLLGGALLTAIPRLYDTVKAVQALRTAAPATSAVLGGLGKAAGIAAAAFVGFEIIKGIHNSMQTGAVTAGEFTQSLIALSKQGGSMDSAFGKIGAAEFEGDIRSAGDALNKLVNQDFNSAVESFGATVLGIDNGMAKLEAAFASADQAIAAAATSGNLELAARGYRDMAESAARAGVPVEELAKRTPLYADALRQLANEAGVYVSEQELANWMAGQTPAAMLAAQTSTEGQAKAAEVAAKMTEDQAKALDDLGISVTGAITSLDRLVTSMINSGLLSLSARDAARSFEAAIDALDESLKTNGRTLDTTTEKGRANEAAFDAISRAGLGSADAMAKNGESQKTVQGQIKRTYDQLIIAAEKFGITGQAADDMARDVMGIPKDVPIETSIQNYADSMGKLHGIEQKALAVDGMVVQIYAQANIAKAQADLDFLRANSMIEANLYAKGAKYRADGGPVYLSKGGMPPTHMALGGFPFIRKGTDIIPAMLTPGEFVVNPDSTARNLSQLMAINANRHGVTPPAAQTFSVGPQPVHVTVISTNPLTGEQIRQEMVGVADRAIGAANDDIRRGRSRWQ